MKVFSHDMIPGLAIIHALTAHTRRRGRGADQPPDPRLVMRMASPTALHESDTGQPGHRLPNALDTALDHPLTNDAMDHCEQTNEALAGPPPTERPVPRGPLFNN